MPFGTFSGKRTHWGRFETPQRVTDIKNMCREILDGERKPTASIGNSGGMDLMVDDKGVRINFSSRSGMK
jgi:hypothetical protein